MKPAQFGLTLCSAGKIIAAIFSDIEKLTKEASQCLLSQRHFLEK